MNLNVIMGTFYPHKSNTSFSHAFAFQITQKPHELGGPIRLPGNAGTLSTLWTQISPENRCRAGNTYSHLLLVLLKRCYIILWCVRRSEAAGGNARVGKHPPAQQPGNSQAMPHQPSPTAATSHTLCGTPIVTQLRARA